MLAADELDKDSSYSRIACLGCKWLGRTLILAVCLVFGGHAGVVQPMCSARDVSQLGTSRSSGRLAARDKQSKGATVQEGVALA